MKTALMLLLLLSFRFAKAEDTEHSYTLDLSLIGKTQTLPSWLTSTPFASPSAHASISFSIDPPKDDTDLAVTFFFNETPGGFLRVYWAGAASGEMLSDNLFEGIAMPNRRTLVIKRSTLSSPGMLTVQSSDAALNVSRIHWEWANPSSVLLADAASQSALVDAQSKVFSDAETNGAPQLPATDRVQGSIVTAVLTQHPERIESGVAFVAELQARPQYARVEVEISGAQIGTPVQLLANGVVVGEVAVEVPELTDPGYQNGGATPSYIGWRKGSVYIAGAQLKTGENQLQFALKDAAQGGDPAPLAVKNLFIQLKYTTDADAAATPAQQSNDTTSSSSQVVKFPINFKNSFGTLRPVDATADGQ
jgi:hypothetical protein